jgi:hypothetical protein
LTTRSFVSLFAGALLDQVAQVMNHDLLAEGVLAHE